VHPSERVKFAVATAKAVLEDRLDATEAAASMELQVDQVVPQLRSDRDAVTRNESEVVATTLRLLGEQVNDKAMGLPDPSAYTAIAGMLGQMAQSLR